MRRHQPGFRRSAIDASDRDALGPRSVTRDDRDCSLGNLQCVGDHLDELRIRGAIDRRRV